MRFASSPSDLLKIGKSPQAVVIPSTNCGHRVYSAAARAGVLDVCGHIVYSHTRCKRTDRERTDARQWIAVCVALVVLLGAAAPTAADNGDSRASEGVRFASDLTVDELRAVGRSLAALCADVQWGEPKAALRSCIDRHPRLVAQLVRATQLLKALPDSDDQTEQPGRPWCAYRCPVREIMWQDISRDPAEGCALWEEYYTRSLIRQSAWPFCTGVHAGRELVERVCAASSSSPER